MLNIAYPYSSVDMTPNCLSTSELWNLDHYLPIAKSSGAADAIHFHEVCPFLRKLDKHPCEPV